MATGAVWHAFRPMSGFVFWGAQFTVIYAVTAAACARGTWDVAVGGVSFVTLTIVFATLLFGAATAALAWRAWRALAEPDAMPADRFLDHLTLWVNGLGLIAILYNCVPVLILPVCFA